MSKRSGRTISKIKYILFEKDPHCHYCGILTHLSPSGEPSLPCEYSPDMATVDHVYSKFHLNRWVMTSGNRYVLSCNDCNNKRQREEYENLPILEQTARNHGFRPILQRTFKTIEESFNEMRKIYIRHGVPFDHLIKQVEQNDLDS